MDLGECLDSIGLDSNEKEEGGVNVDRADVASSLQTWKC